MIWKFGNSSKSKTESIILELEFLEPSKCLNPRVFKIKISKNSGPVGLHDDWMGQKPEPLTGKMFLLKNCSCWATLPGVYTLCADFFIFKII